MSRAFRRSLACRLLFFCWIFGSVQSVVDAGFWTNLSGNFDASYQLRLGNLVDQNNLPSVDLTFDGAHADARIVTSGYAFIAGPVAGGTYGVTTFSVTSDGQESTRGYYATLLANNTASMFYSVPLAPEPMVGTAFGDFSISIAPGDRVILEFNGDYFRGTSTLINDVFGQRVVYDGPRVTYTNDGPSTMEAKYSVAYTSGLFSSAIAPGDSYTTRGNLFAQIIKGYNATAPLTAGTSSVTLAQLQFGGSVVAVPEYPNSSICTLILIFVSRFARSSQKFMLRIVFGNKCEQMPISLDIVPSTVRQAAELIASSVSAEERERIGKSDPSDYHFGLGLTIRNAWSLWSADTPLKRDALQNYGITHPDDISSLILTWAWALVRGEEFDAAAHCNRVRKPWEKPGRTWQKEVSS